MNKAIRQKAVVKPGGVIKIQSSELPVGTEVDVIVIMETAAKKEQSLRSIISASAHLTKFPVGELSVAVRLNVLEMYQRQKFYLNHFQR